MAILGPYLAQILALAVRLCRALAPSHFLDNDSLKRLSGILPESLVQPTGKGSIATAVPTPRKVPTARPPASPAEKKRASAPKDGTAAVKKAQQKKRRGRSSKSADPQNADESDSASEVEPKKTSRWYSIVDPYLLANL